MDYHTACLLLVTVASVTHGQNQFDYHFVQPDEYSGICPPGDGWSQEGTRCYKLYTQGLPLEDAKHTCDSLGAELLQVDNYVINKKVGALVTRDSDGGVTHWWMGMRFVGETPAPESTQAEWVTGEHTDLRVAPMWDYEQPDSNDGSCVMVMARDDGAYPWSMESCDEELPYVCMSRVCQDGQFLCLNGKCISDDLLCDDYDDCGDGSDLIDCPDLPCVELQTGSEGSFSTPGSTYPSEASCKWTIEGPIGSKIRLQFTSFETEENFDVVDIFEGGKTIPTSNHVAKVSGSPEGEQFYISNNNLMIVTFSADKFSQLSGLSASWRTDYPCDLGSIEGAAFPDVTDFLTTRTSTSLAQCMAACEDNASCNSASYDDDTNTCYIHDRIEPPVESEGFHYVAKRCPGTTGTAATDVLPNAGGSFQVTAGPKYIMSPFYPIEYYSGLRLTWRLDTGVETTRITIQRLDVDLGDEDRLRIFNGRDPSNNNLIAEYWGSGDNEKAYHVAMTTQQHGYVQLRTERALPGKRGIMFKYFTGCTVEIEARTTVIQSPSYSAVDAVYAPNMACVWMVSNPNDNPARLMFDPDREYEIGSGDNIEIYAADSDDGTVTEEAGTGTARPDTVDTADGNLYIKFTTDGSGEAAGFYAVYSENCPEFEIDDNTMINVNNVDLATGDGSSFGDSFTLRCRPGYYLRHEEFAELDNDITMECTFGGKWNYRTTPKCETQNCGLPPRIANGFISNIASLEYASDGSGGVTYECFTGFEMTGVDTATCNSDGMWENVPSCNANSCPPISESDNLRVNITNTEDPDDPKFGAIATYYCDEGYVMNGNPYLIYCTQSSEWSSPITPASEQPMCTPVQCEVPFIANRDETGEQAGEMVNFPNTVDIACRSGFELVGESTITCMANMTFGFEAIPTCEDINECEPVNPCAQECVNTAPGRTCVCADGYIANGDDCDDIDECANGNGGCDDECTNSEGGYECSCTQTGYVLFESEGFMGYQKFDEEDGMTVEDLMRFNHTCVRIECPLEWTAPDNSRTLTNTETQHYYYQDEIEVLCDFTYITADDRLSYNVVCGADGEWRLPDDTVVTADDEGVYNLPACQEVQCAPFVLPTGDDAPQNPPASVEQEEPIRVDDEVIFNCVHDLDGEFELKQTCTFDIISRTYKLIGDAPECGVVDCGTPPNVPGMADGLLNGLDTIYDPDYANFFDFDCAVGYTIAGSTDFGDTLEGGNALRVTCRLDETYDKVYWDFGSITCSGPRCTDPGRPPSAKQEGDSYEDGETITFVCDREGYEVDRADGGAMTCDGANSAWVPPHLPNCVDVEPPTFPQCNHTVIVQKYTTLSRIDLQPIDNTGVDTITADADIRTPVTENVDVTFTATDFQGLSADCLVHVEIADDTPPVFTCDNEATEYIILTERSDTETTIPEVPEVTGHVSVVTRPERIMSDINDLNHITVVDFVANDGNGNEATCRKQYTVKGTNCSPWLLRTPAHATGAPECVTNDNSVTCTFTCEDDYFFFYDNAAHNTVEHTCNTNDDAAAWTPLNVLDCIQLSDATYNMEVELIYQDVSITAGCKDPYEQTFHDNAVQAAANLQRSCRDTLRDTDLTVEVTEDEQIALLSHVQQRNYKLQLTIGPREKESSRLKACARVVESNFNINTLRVAEGTTQVLATIDAFSCDEGSISGSVIQQSGLVCTNGVLQGEEDAEECAPCPTGTYYIPADEDVAASCMACPLGQYSNVEASEECTDCPEGTYTYEEGATGEDLCYVTCPRGFISDNLLAPCEPCPVDTYWKNTTYCAPCANETAFSTLGNTAVGSFDGCIAPCPAGSVSATGYEPCNQCPHGYFSTEDGQTECEACPNGGSTPGTGTTTQDDCTLNEAELCVEDVSCLNGGTCSINTGQILCDCLDGYTGLRCETDINECSSSPCHHGAQCTTPEVNGYQCNCLSVAEVIFTTFTDQAIAGSPFLIPQTMTSDACQEDCRTNQECNCYLYHNGQCYRFTDGCTEEELVTSTGQTSYIKGTQQSSDFSGDTCEIEVNGCVDENGDDLNHCGDNGMCKDLRSGYECLCIPPYEGIRCETQGEICAADSCNGHGECIEMSATRRRCACDDGFTGEDCETNINECDPNPCLYGGMCTDQENGFNCECPTGFTNGVEGRCETRPANLCNNINCGNSGDCYEYYIRSEAVCMCDPGYTSTETYSKWFDVDDSASNQNETIAAHMASEGGAMLCPNGQEIVRVECRDKVTGFAHDHDGNNDVFGEGGHACTVEHGLLCLEEEQENNGQCSDYEVRYYCGVDSNTCVQIEECNDDPCENGATCAGNTVDGYVCSCVDGYGGHNCQHEKQECESNPCMHGGVCVELINRYNCTCLDGYEGEHCETNIDDCADEPCQNEGTCEDGVDGFTCECEAGYDGETCENDIDECTPDPCYNGGVCTHGIDSYECECADGWTGDRCEEQVDTCEEAGVECENGGTCYSVFDDTFCACVPGSVGELCGETHLTCDLDNVCDNGGTCMDSTEETSGAECLCPTAFTGDACERERDFCSDTNNVCENDGECVLIDEDPGYECRCARGFEGPTCAENTDDCAGITCEQGGECIDGVGQAFCDCVPGRSGPTCNKEIDRNYDFRLDGEGGTQSLRPHYFNVTSFSISLWVRTEEEAGTLLCIYGAESQNTPTIEADKLVLCATLAGADMYDDEGQLVAHQAYPDTVDLTDGQWHSIVVAWDIPNTRVSALVDTVGRPVNMAEATRDTVPEYAMFTLGWKGRELFEDDVIYSGMLSRVFVWDHVMTSSQITNAARAPTDNSFIEVEADDLLLDWDGYELVGSVQRIFGTTVCRDTCQAQGTIARPTLAPTSSCPDDVITGNSNDPQSVQWDAPIFNDATEILASYEGEQPSETFNPGIWDIAHIGLNSEKSSAECLFRITVRGGDCPDLQAPEGDSDTEITCSSYGELGTYKGCTMTCPENFGVLEPIPNIFTCGAHGVWNYRETSTDFKLPACGALGEAFLEITFSWVYNLDGPALPGVLTTLEQDVRSQFAEWSAMQDPEFCKQDDCGDLEITPIVDEDNDEMVMMDCRMPNTSTTFNVDGEEEAAESLLRRAITSEESIVYVENVPGGNNVEFSTLEINGVVFCLSGYQAVSGQCVQCTAGTYYNSTQEKCIKCAVGYYQSEPSALQCEPCDEGYTTAGESSTSVADCFISCPPGEFHNVDDDVCEECARGRYNEQFGQTECSLCPEGETTVNNGTSEQALCIDDCPGGQYFDEDSNCVVCPIATYKQRVIDLDCMPCPFNRTTDGEGADSPEDCNLVICDEGYYRLGLDECQLCQIGTYRSEEMDNCTACEPGFTTVNIGAVNDTFCTRECEAGYYLSQEGDEPSECVMCPQGSYKTDSIDDRFATQCHNCSDGFTTLQEGATSYHFCVFGVCNAGQVYNNDTDSCEDCPYGWYQSDPLPTIHACMECPAEESTRLTGSDSPDDCEAICPSGQEMGNSECTTCERGYYKDNGEDNANAFSACELCPTEFITEDEGATSAGACTVRNCTEGTFLNTGNNMCVDCDMSSYQDEVWQTECKPCPEGSSAPSRGSTSEADCSVSQYRRYSTRIRLRRTFTMELKDENSGLYIELRTLVLDAFLAQLRGKEGFHKLTFRGFRNGSTEAISDVQMDPAEAGGADAAEENVNEALEAVGVPVPGDPDTRMLGVEEIFTPDADADVEDRGNTVVGHTECQQGTINEIGGADECTPCERGTYHPEIGKDICLPCDTGYTTAGDGSFEADDCIIQCAAGERRDEGECVPCAIGEYQEQSDYIETTCTACPNDETTEAVGSNSSALCYVYCEAGHYYDDTMDPAVCAPCPLHHYNPTGGKKGVESCIDCPNSLETTTNGRAQLADCKDPCGINTDYCNGHGACSYNDVDSSVRCFCDDGFEGGRCATRSDPDDDAPLIIGFSVGAFALFMAIVLLSLMIYRIRNPVDPPLKPKMKPQFTRQPTALSPTMPPSQGPNMYRPMGVNAPAHPARVAPPSQMVEQGQAPFKFYEDRDDNIPSASQIGGGYPQQLHAPPQNYAASTAFFQR